jgi:hypothetical protein
VIASAFASPAWQPLSQSHSNASFMPDHFCRCEPGIARRGNLSFVTAQAAEEQAPKMSSYSLFGMNFPLPKSPPKTRDGVK